jgi:hypothetical protein
MITFAPATGVAPAPGLFRAGQGQRQGAEIRQEIQAFCHEVMVFDGGS